MGIGVFKMLPTHSEVPEVDITKYNVSSEPTTQTATFSFDENDFKENDKPETNVKDFQISFTTLDVFSVNNPIKVNAILKPNDPARIESVYLQIISISEFDHVKRYQIEDYIKEYEKKLISLSLANNSDTFSGDSEALYSYQGETTFLLIIKTKDGNFEVIARDLPLITIYPYSEKLQTDLNRLTIAQIDQNNRAIQSQNRSNSVIEGLTWILLGWLPVDLAISLKK